ncbi:MAG: alpha/beta fold hydrolase [Rhodothermales bacterium]|nr:alpha/beta fold hydrolase [Rhodothermales bacterium]
MKVLVYLAVCMILPHEALAQVQVDPEIFGDWSGSIRIQGVELTIITHFSSETSTIDIPQQGAIGLQLQNVSATKGKAYFELPAGPGLAVFDGVISGDSIAGSFTQAGASGTFDLARAEAEAAVTNETAREGESVALAVSDGTLHGTLLLPESPPPFPLVILISGSGPTDRDGNSVGLGGKNNSLRLLAEALKGESIATFRYDKRGIGESVVSISESDLRIDSFAVDVSAWHKFMARDARFSKIILAGHSEGALLASIAANADGIDGLISIAGAGRRAEDVLRQQLVGQLPAELMTRTESILASLTRGETTDDVPEQLLSLFRPSVQPYMISWFARDPAELFNSAKAPKLILQGETDIQVNAADAERLAQYSPDAKLRVIAGMNHVLKRVSSDRAEQLASYTNPDLPVHADLVSAIVEFVTEVPSQR